MQQILRVAIYARVSSDQQSGDNTIASQVTALQAARLGGWIGPPSGSVSRDSKDPSFSDNKRHIHQ